MNDISAFEPATPAIVVGRSFDGSPPPLGLGEPFALLGGDRLGPDGVAFRVMHDHQPGLLRWIRQSCHASLVAERPWFKGSPLLLPGRNGAGRTHAARRLAAAAGVPHVIINLSDPVIAANIAASRRVNEALWALPTTIAMAATRCANPVATVIGADQASGDVTAGLLSMIDPDLGRSWSEDQLRTHVDFSEVTWIVQCDDVAGLPADLRNSATPVVLERTQPRIESVFTLSIMLEAMSDLGIDPADPLYSWVRIRGKLGQHHAGGCARVYADMVNTLMALQQMPIGEENRRPKNHENFPF